MFDCFSQIEDLVKDFLIKEKVSFHKVSIGAGASLLYHGVRDVCDDIDLTTKDKTWFKQLKKRLPTHTFERPDGTLIEVVELGNKMDLHLHHGDEEFDTVTMLTQTGLYVETLKSILEFKLYLNRAKDVKDIKAIEKKLGLN